MADSIIKPDYFDLLPDPILLLIFNKLLDAKSLCSSLLVCKRFASLVPEVDSMSVQMGPRRLAKSSGSKSGNFFRGLVLKLAQIMGKKTGLRKEVGGFDVVDWIGTALRNFKDLQSLKLELPCYGGEIGVSKTIPLLKWEASFGKELDSCVILGATSISILKTREVSNVVDDAVAIEEDEPIFSDEELKLRIIWIISCLIASSARHNLMKKVLNCCPKLSSAVILDSGKQGKLCMNAEQIREFRDSSSNPATESQMGYVGNLVMKLWYVKELELGSSGKVMKGATMVVIRPDTKAGNNGGEKEMMGFEEDGVFGEAAMELMSKKERRVYRLEMNTF